MHFGFKHIKSDIPLIVKRIAIVCGGISTAISSYGYFIENSPLIMKIGGGALIISIVLPQLFGIPKEEVKHEE